MLYQLSNRAAAKLVLLLDLLLQLLRLGLSQIKVHQSPQSATKTVQLIITWFKQGEISFTLNWQSIQKAPRNALETPFYS